jgi:DNA invertase Pin-like site-specific DNA recombinase
MNAIIYSRVSTEDQNNERQVKELIQHAKYKKYKLLAVFEEKISGGIKGKERTEFKRLLEFIEKNKVNVLLVHEISRLGRSLLDVVDNLKFFTEKGINIYFHKENGGMYTLDANGNLEVMTTIIISVLSGFAQMEKERIKQRSISGIRNNVAGGGSGTGIIMPYGYKKVGKKLIVDEDEAETIRLIFAKYLTGLGTTQIAKYLNLEKIPTRFNKIYPNKMLTQKHGLQKKGADYTWRDGTIYRILTNTIYYGDRRHKGEVFPIAPIITESTFKKVQETLKSKYNKKDINRIYPNPLNNILICGKCGKSYWMHKRQDNSDNAYKCISKRYSGEYCGNPSINIDKLLDALYLYCLPIIYTDEIDKKDEHKLVLKEKISNKQISLNNTIKEVQVLNIRKKKLIEMHLDGKVSGKEFTEFNTANLSALQKKEEQILLLTNELDKLKRLIEIIRPEGSYSKDMFNNYIKDAVEYIKIYGVNAKGRKVVKHAFPASYDVIVIVEVKPIFMGLDENGNEMPIYYHFALSRRTKNIANIEFDSTKLQYSNQIENGSFKSTFYIPMQEELPPELKNHYIVRRGDKTSYISKYTPPQMLDPFEHLTKPKSKK